MFELMDRAGALFVQERYRDAIPLLERILKSDPFNLDAALRLATSYSSLGDGARALAAFKEAAAIAPRSPDVRVYLALHYARGKDWQQAVPMLERIVAETPEKQPAVEALSVVRVRQGRLAMERGDTAAAIRAFEDARRLRGESFAHDLDLGVLYLDARRLTEARDALDRVPASHPDYPMALFKRAQVSVLLNEPDSAARIARARQYATPLTRGLIDRERLFRNAGPR
jgi:protein O-GlcNAc transferase